MNRNCECLIVVNCQIVKPYGRPVYFESTYFKHDHLKYKTWGSNGTQNPWKSAVNSRLLAFNSKHLYSEDWTPRGKKGKKASGVA